MSVNARQNGLIIVAAVDTAGSLMLSAVPIVSGLGRDK